MKKKISILGSTGSIGLTSLKIIDKRKSLFNINLLSANKNYKLILKQIKKYKPKYYFINNQKIYDKVKNKLKGRKTKIINSLNNLVKIKSNITISAIPGIAGLEPTLIMTKLSEKILLANKESIICGWSLIDKISKKKKTKIIPIDSEHFSIMKLIYGHNINEIKKVYLTASGGPFLNYKVNQLRKIIPKDALKHPKWKMGKKVTIDSSTLMNKILELVEAQKLFNFPVKKLDILIHPNSLVHAIIQFKNGLTKFIYHDTSMIIPLANAIFDDKLNIEEFYKEERNKNDRFEDLIFKKVDKKIFPMIKLKDRINEHPSTPIIVNAANEILVDQFLKRKIAFLSIYKIILSILKDRNYRKYAIRKPKKINQIYNIDNWARITTIRKIKNA